MGSSLVFVALLSFAACCYCASANSMLYKSELEILAHEELRMIVDSLVNEKIGAKLAAGERRMLLGSFDYKNCGDPAKEVVVVSNMSIKPDPVVLPGKINISFDAVIKAKFGAPLTAKLEVYKEILGIWIKIPCVDNVGSCTYDNICAQLAKLVKTCPPALVKQGVTCHCPVSPAKVSLKNYPVAVNVKVPSVADGNVRVKVELSSGNTPITCMEMTLKLE